MLLSESVPRGPLGFAARIRSTPAGDVFFSDNQASSSLAMGRPADTIVRSGAGYYMLSLVLEGSCVLFQDGRSVELRAGNFALYETSRPYSLFFTSDHREFVMRFPKERLAVPHPFADQLTAAVIDDDTHMAPVVQAYLLQLSGLFQSQSTAARQSLARTAIELLEAMFSQLLGVTQSSQTPRETMMRRICEFIDGNLTDPGLSPEVIARAHFISTRHLRALFREDGMSVTAYLRRERLEQCRRALVHPETLDRDCAAIGASWGFTSAAHFNRSFKEAFGTTPGKFRSQQLR